MGMAWSLVLMLEVSEYGWWTQIVDTEKRSSTLRVRKAGNRETVAGSHLLEVQGTQPLKREEVPQMRLRQVTLEKPVREIRGERRKLKQ